MIDEYFTEAVVLDTEPAGEFDSRAHLFTCKLGRVTAIATSTRKILSKLSGHLEPLNIIQVRLVRKNRFQVADVLKIAVLPKENLAALHLIKEIAPEAEPDSELWRLILTGPTETGVLRVLGFDSEFASCQNCGLKKGLKFSTTDLVYFCSDCRSAGNSVL